MKCCSLCLFLRCTCHAAFRVEQSIDISVYCDVLLLRECGVNVDTFNTHPLQDGQSLHGTLAQLLEYKSGLGSNANAFENAAFALYFFIQDICIYFF